MDANEGLLRLNDWTGSGRRVTMEVALGLEPDVTVMRAEGHLAHFNRTPERRTAAAVNLPLPEDVAGVYELLEDPGAEAAHAQFEVHPDAVVDVTMSEASSSIRFDLFRGPTLTVALAENG